MNDCSSVIQMSGIKTAPSVHKTKSIKQCEVTRFSKSVGSVGTHDKSELCKITCQNECVYKSTLVEV